MVLWVAVSYGNSQLGFAVIDFYWLARKIADDLASIQRYCLFLNDLFWSQTACHINNFDPGHTRLK